MKIVHFELKGRFGHFLYAEANVSMPSYPLPPRTAILGLIGAVLGLGKDIPQTELEPAYIALGGRLPDRFWVTNKFHQSLSSPLPHTVVKSIKGSNSEIKNQKMLTQEWLFNPRYELWVSLPEKYHDHFAERIKNRRWHYCPSLGISEHIAELKWIENGNGINLSKSKHYIFSSFPEYAGKLDMDEILDSNLELHFIRMPSEVSEGRIFNHKNYYFERNMKPVPIITSQAVQVNNQKIIFM